MAGRTIGWTRIWTRSRDAMNDVANNDYTLPVFANEYRALAVLHDGALICGPSLTWSNTADFAHYIMGLGGTDTDPATVAPAHSFTDLVACDMGEAVAVVKSGPYEIRIDRRLAGIEGRWLMKRRPVVLVPVFADLRRRRVTVPRPDGVRETMRLREEVCIRDSWVTFRVDEVLESVP